MLHFLGVSGLPKRKKKPRQIVVESDPEESIETNSGGSGSPKQLRRSKRIKLIADQDKDPDYKLSPETKQSKTTKSSPKKKPQSPS